jgi:hypothetical protein
VAVYPEVRRCDPPVEMYKGSSWLPSSAPAPHKRAMAADMGGESAGTGYGREEYSPVRTVEFEPERAAAEKVYVKYEWRETLCRKGIIACGKPLPPNRMWGEDGYAPPPPGRN